MNTRKLNQIFDYTPTVLWHYTILCGKLPSDCQQVNFKSDFKLKETSFPLFELLYSYLG